MNINEMTTDELRKELERRENPPAPARPKWMSNRDYSDLRDLCESYIDYIESGEYCSDNDFRSYIYEAALDAIYGEAFWAWKTKCLETK